MCLIIHKLSGWPLFLEILEMSWDFILEDDPFLAKGPGKVVELSFKLKIQNS